MKEITNNTAIVPRGMECREKKARLRKHSRCSSFRVESQFDSDKRNKTTLFTFLFSEDRSRRWLTSKLEAPTASSSLCIRREWQQLNRVPRDRKRVTYITDARPICSLNRDLSVAENGIRCCGFRYLQLRNFNLCAMWTAFVVRES